MGQPPFPICEPAVAELVKKRDEWRADAKKNNDALGVEIARREEAEQRCDEQAHREHDRWMECDALRTELARAEEKLTNTVLALKAAKFEVAAAMKGAGPNTVLYLVSLKRVLTDALNEAEKEGD
jgi:hypothetical protein